MKNLLMILLVSALPFAATAQDRSITFEHVESWKDVVEVAKAKDRLIFVDCYTDWCGPCRKIANEVFTLNEVADFFNANFVNVKFEMEKHSDGPALAAKYEVRAYPTFLFINPHTEELEYIKVGGDKGHQWLIDAGELSMNSEFSKSGMTRRYENGDRDPELVSNYIQLLGSLGRKEEQAGILEEWLDSHTTDQIFTEEGWLVVSQALIDPVSKYFPVIVENREKFYEIAGRETVDNYLNYVVKTPSEQLIHPVWEPAAFIRRPDADERFPLLIKALEGVDYPSAIKYLAFLKAADLANREQWDALLAEVRKTDESDVLVWRDEYDYFRYNFTPLSRGNASEAQRAEAVGILDEKINGEEEWEIRRAFQTLKNAMLRPRPNN